MGIAPIGLMASVWSVFVALRLRAPLRAAAARRVWRYWLLLHRVAESTDLSVVSIAVRLGATPEQMPRWEKTGVPADWQPAVADLVRAATALRRELPASVTRRLLMLRHRRATELEQLARCETGTTDLFRRRSPRHFHVTMRR
jgi:hypothetical protein